MRKPTPLAIYRFAAGLTQKELAERCGLTRPTVVKLENGHHRPRRLTAIALANALNTTPDVLFPIHERPDARSDTEAAV